MPRVLLEDNEDDSNWTQLRTAIKNYLIMVRVEKQLLLHLQCHPMALFQITWSLLEQEIFSDHLEGHADEFVQYLMDKVTWIHSQLDPIYDASPCEMPGVRSCSMIWEQGDPVGSGGNGHTPSCCQCYQLSDPFPYIKTK